MGFEAFRVELRGGNASVADADKVVRAMPHVHGDPDSPQTRGSTCYLMEDGQHVLELELMDAPVRLSCRFTLCHPPSVDTAYLGLVHELMTRLGMDAKICDDVTPEHSRSYSLAEFGEFSKIALRYVAVRRAEWIKAFGDEPLAAATTEVHERIILPRCETGIEQPT